MMFSSMVQPQKSMTHDAKVLETIRKVGLKLNNEKCKFGLPCVNFLGNLISKKGVTSHLEKKEAIEKLQQPNDVSELVC